MSSTVDNNVNNISAMFSMVDYNMNDIIIIIFIYNAIIIIIFIFNDMIIIIFI